MVLSPLAFVRQDALLVTAGALSGLLLHPDLDMSPTPYGRVRKHRGLSHYPLVGTVDRVLWFLGPVLVAWLLTGREVAWAGLGLWLVGLTLADALHWLLDR